MHFGVKCQLIHQFRITRDCAYEILLTEEINNPQIFWFEHIKDIIKRKWLKYV